LSARTLHWRLVRNIVALQAAGLVAFLALIVGMLALNDSNDDGSVVDALKEVVIRDGGGRLALRGDQTLDRLRAEHPGLWFVIRDGEGGALSDGAVPPLYAGTLGPVLDGVDRAKLGWGLGRSGPSAAIKRVETAAGIVQILAGTGEIRRENGTVRINADLDLEISDHIDDLGTWLRVAGALLLVVVVMGILPILVIMAASTAVATPIVVRRALATLVHTAAHAALIDLDRLNVRLPEQGVPGEVMPLVRAVNQALDRLAESYARHNRFLADAAHELRTPIAILRGRLELLVPGPDRARLLDDVGRLGALAEQLLDLQRLDVRPPELRPLDLVALARRVVEDVVPLVLAGGYDIAFEAEDDPVVVPGDRLALEQALTNLLRNAIDHGGGRGLITVRVDPTGVIEVADQGPGISPDERDRVFEPFHRLAPRATGAGLGLCLVREIARRHGGRVTVADAPGGGALLRLVL
jgi:signal transduction histidine kinase